MPDVDGLLADPERPAGLLEADVLMIPRGCPHPEEAFKFLLFMQRQDVQEELALAHCKPSPFVRASPGFFENHPNRSVRAFDAIAKSPRVTILPRTTCWKQYADLINAAFDAIWLGADARATILGVQARARQLIEAARTRKKQRGEVPLTSALGGQCESLTSTARRNAACRDRSVALEPLRGSRMRGGRLASGCMDCSGSRRGSWELRFSW